MKKLSIILLSLAGFALFACQEELQPGTTLYPKKAESFDGVKVFVNETVNNNIYKSVYNSTPKFVEIPEDTASFYVQVNHVQKEPIVVKAALEGLPDGTWKFVEGHDQVTIPAGQTKSSSDVRIVLVENNELIHMAEYTDAKVTLEVVSGPAEVGENLNTFTWNIRNRYTIIYLGTIEGLEDKQFVGGTDWTPYSSSTYPERFYDGSYSSYIYLTANAAAKVPSMYADLNSPAILEGIGFVPYGTSATYLTRYWLGEAEFYISNDGENWTSVGVIAFNVGEPSTWQVVRFYEPTKARYIGCKFNRNYGSYYSSVYFGEMGIFGDLSVREVYTTPESAFVRVGKTIHLDAAQRPVNAPETLTLTWSSADPSIATVDAEGNVTGVAPGMTQIIATGGSFQGKTDLVVRENKPQEFFGNYTLTAPTGTYNTSTVATRHIELKKVSDTELSFTILDEDQVRVINGTKTYLSGKFPFEKVDDDHYRMTWIAGTPMHSGNYLTAGGAECQVYTGMLRNNYTSNSYRTLSSTDSVDIDFEYDELTGSFVGTFGETHWGSYKCTGIALYYHTLARPTSISYWMYMLNTNYFSFEMRKD